MSHWPDLERCKALRAAGFPQETEFYWTENTAWEEIPRESIHHKYNTATYHDILCAAPIFTELIEEIRKLKEGRYMRVFIGMGANDGANVLWQGIGEYVESYAGNLPNALADPWLWLREKGEKG